MSAHCFAQESFSIKDTLVVGSFDIAKYTVNPDNIFEDSLYIVSKTCSGEWGGTIKFKNKKTGVEYATASTCPVVVNKLNRKYYTTNTLAHLIGFTQILEVSNPDSMSVYKLPKSRSKKGKTTIIYIGDDESKSTKETKPLVDSLGVLTLASFAFEGQLYHVVTDHNMTFLSKIENSRLVTIDTISAKSLWTFEPFVFKDENGHLMVALKNQQVEGILDIFENQITIMRKDP